MSFNRLNYDQGTYTFNLKQSIGEGDYMINTPRIECNGCFPADPSVTLGKYGASLCDKPLVDVDSELKIINRKASNCPIEKYLPQGDYCNNKVHLQDCRALPKEDTRLSNPACTLRSTGWNRWEWLCRNPQDKALMAFDYNIANRLVVKDNHRPCIQRPIDQSHALPPLNASDDTVSYDTSSCEKQPLNDIPSVHWRKCSAYANYL
jgi:hypothetical protein